MNILNIQSISIHINHIYLKEKESKTTTLTYFQIGFLRITLKQNLYFTQNFYINSYKQHKHSSQYQYSIDNI